MSHIVQVVSMLDVIIKLGDSVFQSREVRGAVWSGVLLFDKSAKGVSLATERSRCRPVMELVEEGPGVSAGKDHNRR